VARFIGACLTVIVVVAIAIFIGTVNAGPVYEASGRADTGSATIHQDIVVGPAAAGAPGLSEPADVVTEPQWERRAVRGAVKDNPTWFTLEHPTTWWAYTDGRLAIVLHSNPPEPQPYPGSRAKLEIYQSLGDTGLDPDPDSVNSMVLIGGAPAVRTDRTDDSGDTLTTFALQVDGVNYDIVATVINASTDDERAALASTLERIVESMRFVPMLVDTAEWQQSEVPGGIGPVDGLHIAHPQGWSIAIAATGDSLTVSGTPSGTEPPAGPITVLLSPAGDVSEADWDTSEKVEFNAFHKKTRLADTGTVEGSRFDQYYINTTKGVLSATVITPILDYDSDEYWRYDQTAWWILTESVMFVDAPESGYP
jgi:hypothetical protein